MSNGVRDAWGASNGAGQRGTGLGGLGVRVGWVAGPSERGGVYPGRAEPVR